LTYEELKARIGELEKEARTGSLQFKVGTKGGVSVNGFNRLPVTFCYEQWIRLLDAAPELHKFLEASKSKLSRKNK